ncbi:TnsD family Tn7-like transposition protein [Paenibacillus sp. FSL P4-0502]|uniref:TnsD family Tn7-like transposition protein n=1 Tax=Paenibacillus sp. FSL P4-0502 TaxID=2975319 RepID=UPI0030FBC45F
MMISFDRYEDELLYSCLARNRLRSGTISHKAFIKDVFGTEGFSASVDLQPGIGGLISNLPVGSTITAEQIIFQNTMYLFHTAFRNVVQSKAIYNELAINNGRDIHNSIGLMSSSIRPNSHFMFCPLCAREDMESLGEFYFRRIHQISGIMVCGKHGIWLNQSQVLLYPSNSYVFEAASPINCDLRSIRKVDDTKILKQYRSLTNCMESLLNTKYPNREVEWFFRCYKNAIKRKGYTSIKGRVNQKQIQSEFLDFYGEPFLLSVQSSVEAESNWLRLFFQRHRRYFHPIRHLLVIQFLGLSLEEVFYNDHSADSAYLPNKPKRKIMKKTMTEEYKSKAMKERHNEWLRLKTENPQLGMNDLRKLSPKTYAWLYLYDRQFLFEHAPQKVGSRGGQVRVDWKQRDRETLEKVTKAFETLRHESGRPNRVTASRIQEVIGEKCLQKKHLDKMPATKKYLESIVETPERFGERRIQWAINEMQKDGEPMLWWRVIRRAGIFRKEPADWIGNCII